jgi:hypothetical protein
MRDFRTYIGAAPADTRMSGHFEGAVKAAARAMSRKARTTPPHGGSSMATIGPRHKLVRNVANGRIPSAPEAIRRALKAQG